MSQQLNLISYDILYETSFTVTNILALCVAIAQGIGNTKTI